MTRFALRGGPPRSVLPSLASARGSSGFRIGSAPPLRFQRFVGSGESVACMSPALSLARLGDDDWGEELTPASTRPPRTSDVFSCRAGTHVYGLDSEGLTAGTCRARIAIGAGGQLYAESSLR